MTIVKSIKIEQGHRHRQHRSKKNRKNKLGQKSIKLLLLKEKYHYPDFIDDMKRVDKLLRENGFEL